MRKAPSFAQLLGMGSPDFGLPPEVEEIVRSVEDSIGRPVDAVMVIVDQPVEDDSADVCIVCGQAHPGAFTMSMLLSAVMPGIAATVSDDGKPSYGVCARCGMEHPYPYTQEELDAEMAQGPQGAEDEFAAPPPEAAAVATTEKECDAPPEE